jgi:imidazolonepropionase
MRELGIVRDAAVAVVDGRITAVGPERGLRSRYRRAIRVDCEGRLLMPALVDSHTHAVFGAPRFAEHEMRAAGLDYMEIARRGGGIHSSVRDTRARTEDELFEWARSTVQDHPHHDVP